MYVYLSSIFLLGLIIGSFISALTYRIPRELQFVKGRSFCDSCKKKLNWYDNIPLFSYLYYQGKSRCCNQKISIRYPLIEIFSAIGIVLLSPIHYLLFVICLAIFIIDLEHQIIPDELSWLILLLGLINFSFVNIFAGFFFSLLLLTLYLITKGRGMGLGDVKLSIGLGVWLGWLNGWKWLMLSFIIGGIVAVILLLLKRANLKTKIAFGPFLIFAFWIVLFFVK
ncbi:MAG: prepilin peptidase [Candidatus Woesebacteria bacterium]|nr:prepilin peptidase [Candidatus Woesebacteria bacterium]